MMKQRKLRNRLLELIQERERKIRRRIKQHDLATFIGVADNTITNWIHNDVSRFDAKIVEGICDYFDCEIEDLFYFEWVEVDDPNM